jgi:sugar phosphate isomerase/epimerase
VTAAGEPLEVGVFVRCYVRPSLDAALDAVRRDGFRTVHLSRLWEGLSGLPGSLSAEAALTIRGQFGHRGLVIGSLSGSFNTIHPDPRRRRQETASACALIARCPLLGARLVTLSSGTRDADDMWRGHPANADAAAWRDLTETLTALLQAADAAKVMLAVEPEPANVVADASLALRLLREMRSRRLQVVLDPANLFHGARGAGVVADAIDRLGPWVACVHLKDVLGWGRRVGDLDLDRVLRRLLEAGVRAPLFIQDTPEADLPHARAHVLARREACRRGGA